MQLEAISRRSFLRIGAVVSATTTAVVLGGYSWFSDNEDKNYATNFGTLLVFNQQQATTLFAYAEAILPEGDGFPDANTARVVQRLDEEVYFTTKKIASDMKSVLDAMEYLPVFYGKMSRFSKMSKVDRLNFLQGLRDTKNETVKAVVNNCRLVVFNMYYGHESTWAAIGYDGTFTKMPEIMGEQRKYYAKQVEGKII
tara:strand:+ start:2731 stop:3324 length:594 start_codon:yes stop_codon:yes gene_type:complete